MHGLCEGTLNGNDSRSDCWVLQKGERTGLEKETSCRTFDQDSECKWTFLHK